MGAVRIRETHSELIGTRRSHSLSCTNRFCTLSLIN